jgi:hypothetical protein
MSTQIRGRIDIVQSAKHRHAATLEVRQSVGECVLGGPAHASERSRGAPRRHRDQPIAAVRRRAERRIGSADSTECRKHVRWAGVGNVATDDRDAATWEPPGQAMHPHAEITTALRYLLHLKRYPRPIGRNREHGAEALHGNQPAQ